LGAVVVPLNFRFVGSDILFAAEVCNPKVFILGHEFIDTVQSIRKELKTVEKYICLGKTVPEGMVDYKTVESYGDTGEALVDVEDSHNLAMMFTSGTTGKPKPVMHTHFSINNTAIGNNITFTAGRNENYMLYLPLYHSGVKFVWFGYYCRGATGVILTEFKDPNWIIETMAEEKCKDTVFVVPIAVGILNAIKDGDIKLEDYDLSSWTHVGLGAQPIPFEVLKSVAEALKVKVSNIYGTTEGGGGGTFLLYPEDALNKPGSIGKPSFGVTAKVVDESGKEVEQGKVGELIFATPRLMSEYFGNPELTEETIKDGWLYTGDLVKEDEEGFYYIVDRKKDMITSGGENIYPVEIEDALMENPKIDDVACIGAPDDRLVEMVLAIVQVKEGQTMTEEELIEFAKTKISVFKVPRKVIFDQVMRNPTGKLMKPEMREKHTGRKEAFQAL
jgi:acyl-CoA synthetase (AMP-forming)/AMP-acid ligase II